ncbi:MAG: hypothetical protein V3U02_10130, partial [Calditrichia bacterium]
MARLSPQIKTLKALFAKSNNQCAFSGCAREMVNANNDIIGNICHIEAAEEQGPRFNKNQTDEERRHYDNLICFCYEHHKITDDVIKYPVEKLKQYKVDHETGKISSTMDERIELAIKKIEEVNSRLEGAIGGLTNSDNSLKKGYEIFTSDKNEVWLPEQGKFYKTEFDDGNFFEYMMKDNLLYLNHGFPDGAVAYYEIDESGGVKETKWPYQLSEYTVEIPPKMILRTEVATNLLGFTTKTYILKYGRKATLIFDFNGKLFEANIQARMNVIHQDRKINIVDPSNVKY